MIKFSRRTVLLLLVLLILVSIIIRYPTVEHERQQTDSYFIHLLSSLIVDDGRAEWVFNPLSLIGYYPLSYPSGMPFLLASLSSMTGLTIETGILLCNYLLAIAFCLGVFGLSRQFISRTDLAILATFFAVLGSRFVDTTYWNGSARGLIVVFMVLLLFAVFQSRFRGQQRWYALIVVILCIGCLFAHHMAILLVVFAVGYVLATILNIVLQATSTTLRRSVVTFAVLTTCAIAAIMTYSVFVSLWNPVISNFRSTSLFEMDSVIASVILNMAMSYVNQIGLILPVAILGIPIIISGRRPTTNTLFLIVSPIVFIPLLGNAVYVSMLLAPIIAILGIMTISYIVKDGRWSRKMQFFMIFLITFSFVLPLWSVDRWNSKVYVNGDTVEVENQIFNDASYVRYLSDDGWRLSNDNAVSLQLAAISGEAFIISSGIYSVLSGDISEEDVDSNITWSLQRFPINLYKWFEYEEDPRVDVYVRTLMRVGLNSLRMPGTDGLMKEYFATHSRMYLIVDENWPSDYVDSYSVVDAPFLSEVRNASYESYEDGTEMILPSYKCYESERISIFLLGLPTL